MLGESQEPFLKVSGHKHTQTHTNTIDIGTQTDYSPLESILSDLQLLPYDDLVYLFHNLFHNINDEDKVIHLFSLFENLDGENQETFFESLGGIFNEELSRANKGGIKTKTYVRKYHVLHQEYS